MTWDYSTGKKAPWEAKKGPFPKWPDPFANQVKNIEVLACEGEWLAAITMANDGFGAWFWSNWVPQPSELARKWVLGGYRCGFYLGIRLKSPLDIIWRDGRASKFLARLAIGPTSLMWMFWGAQTFFEGLATWHTLIYAAEACDKQNNEVIVGPASNIIDPPYFAGTVGLYNVIWNPKGYYEGLGAHIIVPPGHTARFTAFGVIRNNRGDITSADVWMYDAVGNNRFGQKHYDGGAAGDEWSFETGTWSFTGPATVSIGCEIFSTGPALPFNFIVVERFFGQIDPTPEGCTNWVPLLPAYAGALAPSGT